MNDLGSDVEMGSYVVIDEESVGVSLEWSFEGMVDGHCWVMFEVGHFGYCWVRFGVVGHDWVIFEVGHFEEEAVVTVDC